MSPLVTRNHDLFPNYILAGITRDNDEGKVGHINVNMFKNVCMNSHESGYVQCKNDSENLMYCYAGLCFSVYKKKY